MSRACILPNLPRGVRGKTKDIGNYSRTPSVFQELVGQGLSTCSLSLGPILEKLVRLTFV